MNLRCIIGGHRAAPDRIHNQGFDFSRCDGCRRDMIRSGRRWRTVPKGFRVVWKRKPGEWTEMSARQLLLSLPATGRSLTVASYRSRVSAAEILLLAALGFRYLLWIVAERLASWGRLTLAARSPRQRIICLPALARMPSGGEGS